MHVVADGDDAFCLRVQEVQRGRTGRSMCDVHHEEIPPPHEETQARGDVVNWVRAYLAAGGACSWRRGLLEPERGRPVHGFAQGIDPHDEVVRLVRALSGGRAPVRMRSCGASTRSKSRPTTARKVRPFPVPTLRTATQPWGSTDALRRVRRGRCPPREGFPVPALRHSSRMVCGQEPRAVPKESAARARHHLLNSAEKRRYQRGRAASCATPRMRTPPAVFDAP